MMVNHCLLIISLLIYINIANSSVNNLKWQLFNTRKINSQKDEKKYETVNQRSVIDTPGGPDKS